MALDDFRTFLLPVPLSKGLDSVALGKLRDSPAGAVRGAAAATGKFPLLVLGQGLYYESPLCHFVLCEFLAAHGYVVATSPLRGTRCRLVNITVEDLETEVRDMESVMAEARALPFADPDEARRHRLRPGRHGRTDHGHAPPRDPGLSQLRRGHPRQALLGAASEPSSVPGGEVPDPMDAPHPGPLHPGREGQVRGAVPLRKESLRPELPRSRADDEPRPILLLRGHGPQRRRARLLGPLGLGPEADLRGHLPHVPGLPRQRPQEGRRRLEEWLRAGAAPDPGRPPFRIEHKPGTAAPPAEADLVHFIIDKGFGEARPAIERLHADHPGITLIDESVLNWLGAHFLYWWGREEEAVGVFELNALLYPGSWNARDSLGEAYEARGRKEEAIRSYRRSLELNPDNGNAKAALERLAPPVKKDPV
ncbi:MAG: tetratricopeptide repeat protein [Candidatus Moduliflexus flocculans]|nr:tetratricopeptide repeat protein [Candidatus Moduliflexus flocculans]